MTTTIGAPNTASLGDQPKPAPRRSRAARKAPTGRVAVVTDSLAWLPAPVAEEHGVRVVPLHVRFGDEEYTETVDITTEEFYRRLRLGTPHPQTSQPAPGEFLAAYRELAEETDSIISVHASSRLSGTCNAATQAAALLMEERPGVTVEVVDTQQIATAQGIIALRAAELAGEGATLTHILEESSRLLGVPRVLLAVDTLEYLRRGGRVGRAAAFLGGLLKVRPILTIEGGEVAPLERVRSRARAIERILDLMETHAAGRPFAHVGVGHAQAPEDGQALLHAITDRFRVQRTLFAEIGPVIGTYVGPGAFAVTFHCD